MWEKTFVVGPFQCNCRILACRKTGIAVLVDPGDEAPLILNEIKNLKSSWGAPLQVKYLLHTHAHLDHVGGTREVYQGLSALGEGQTDQRPEGPKIALHPGDDFLYANLKMQGRLFGLHYDDPLPISHHLEDGEVLRVGELKISVLHTPGHSPGSVCFRLHEDSGAGTTETLFSGDTLFQGSVGRTDLWGGDQDVMFKSIRKRILVLDDDTRVCPGHGEDTRIGVEKRKNPYLI